MINVIVISNGTNKIISNLCVQYKKNHRKRYVRTYVSVLTSFVRLRTDDTHFLVNLRPG